MGFWISLYFFFCLFFSWSCSILNFSASFKKAHLSSSQQSPERRHYRTSKTQKGEPRVVRPGLKLSTDEVLKLVLFQVTGKPLLQGAAPEKGCRAACAGRAPVPFMISPLVWLGMTAFSQISTLSTSLFLLPEIISMLAAWPVCKQLCRACNEAIAYAWPFYRKGRGCFSLNWLDSLMRLICFPCSLSQASYPVRRELTCLAM